MGHSAFEPNFTYDMLLVSLLSHAVGLIGVLIFWWIRKFDFAIVGLLMIIVSQMYHFTEFGIFGHVHLAFLHVADFAMIMFFFSVVAFSWYRLDYEKRFLLTLIFIPIPYFLSTYFYEGYAIVAIIVGEFAVLLILQHHYNVTHFKGKIALDKFNVFCLVLAFLLVGTALFFFYWAGSPGDLHYSYRHSIWHFCVFIIYDIISVLYLRYYMIMKEKIEKFERDGGRLKADMKRMILTSEHPYIPSKLKEHMDSTEEDMEEAQRRIDVEKKKKKALQIEEQAIDELDAAEKGKSKTTTFKKKENEQSMYSPLKEKEEEEYSEEEEEEEEEQKKEDEENVEDSDSDDETDDDED